MCFYYFKCVVDFWTNQTILKLTYCNLHHHLVSLNIKKMIKNVPTHQPPKKQVQLQSMFLNNLIPYCIIQPNQWLQSYVCFIPYIHHQDLDF